MILTRTRAMTPAISAVALCVSRLSSRMISGILGRTPKYRSLSAESPVPDPLIRCRFNHLTMRHR